MSSSYGTEFRFTIFGQSHAPAIGVTIEGIPAGERVDLEVLQRFLSRRAPGQYAYTTPRREWDVPEFLCGLKDGRTCGAPITAIIRNEHANSADYAALQDVPRPGHADYTAQIKYGGSQDAAGGGHFSGRLTAPLCIVGGICLQLLQRMGISVCARIASIGQICDRGVLQGPLEDGALPTLDALQGQKMQEKIAQVKATGDSIGGTIECAVLGLPAGLGSPIFGGMENRISQAVFGIPGIKGIEFGDGFAAAAHLGSENNDAFFWQQGRVVTKTNHAGGILGGISNGMPLTFRVACKPTPSIAKMQQSVNLKTGQAAALQIAGRHDPCIVPRAVPCVEAAAAVAVYDAILERRKEV